MTSVVEGFNFDNFKYSYNSLYGEQAVTAWNFENSSVFS